LLKVGKGLYYIQSACCGKSESFLLSVLKMFSWHFLLENTEKEIFLPLAVTQVDTNLQRKRISCVLYYHVCAYYQEHLSLIAENERV
jgi:hypothetical protein